MKKLLLLGLLQFGWAAVLAQVAVPVAVAPVAPAAPAALPAPAITLSTNPASANVGVTAAITGRGLPTEADTTIYLIFTLHGAPAAGTTTVNFPLSIQAATSDITPQFLTSANPIVKGTTITMAVPATAFSTMGGDATYTYAVAINYKYPQKTPLTPLTALISVNNDNTHIYTVTFTPKVDLVNNYWMEVGANFDLIDGVQANNLYSGVFMFEKDIYKKQVFNHTTHVSFTGGVYESKSTSVSLSSDSGLIYRDGSSYILMPKKGTFPGGYPYYRDTGTVSVTTSVQSIGLFFSPHFLLTSRLTTANGYHLYFSFYAEMLWQRVKSAYDYSKTHRDTVLAEPGPGLGGIYTHNYKENSITLDYRSHYLGIGFPMYIKNDDYTFYLNSVVGFTTQQFQLSQGSLSNTSLAGFTTPRSPWNGFYLLQYRLTSETYGISFTGEVRGFLTSQSKPIISISVSKKFDPGKLLSAILGK